MKGYIITFTLIIINLIVFYKLISIAQIFGGDIYPIDFTGYYKLATDSMSGINPYSVTSMQTLGPPLVIIPYIPFAFLPVVLSAKLFVLINLFSGYVMCFILARKYYSKNKINVFLLCSFLLYISFLPRFGLLLGQPMLLLVLVLTLVMVTENKYFKGVGVGLLTVGKSYLALLYVYLLKRDRKAFFIAIVTVVVTLGISLFVFKPEWYQGYVFDELPQTVSNIRTGSGLNYYNQSLASSLSRMGLTPLFVPLYIVLAIIGVYLIYFLGSIELAVMFSILLSPIAWQHYYVLLFPLYVKIFKNIKDIKTLVVFVISFVLWMSNFPFLHYEERSLIYSLLASHDLMALVMLMIVYLTIKKRDIFPKAGH
jgi:hypothetical protein